MSPQTTPAGEARLRAAVAVFAAASLAALLAAERFVFGDLGGFPLDDSWIHLVFARALAAGDGLAFAPGQTVAATTSPLWTALLSLLATLPVALPAAAKLLGALLHVASIDAAFRLGRALDLSPARAALAAALVASTDVLLFAATSGMEVPLFIWLSLEGFRRHLAERRNGHLPPLAFVLFGLAALARPEGLLLVPLAAADRLFRFARRADGSTVACRPDWRRVGIGVLAAALPIAAVALAFAAASGSPLPTTLAAKTSASPSWIPDRRFLAAVLGIAFASQPWVTLLAAGGGVEMVRRLGGPRDRGLLLPAWALALPVGSSMVSAGESIPVGNFGRYFFPLLPPLVLLAVLALDAIPFSRLRRVAVGGLRLPAGAVLLTLLVAVPAARLPHAISLALQARANIDAGDVAMARWVAERVPPEADLAVCDIGAMRWWNDRPLLDLAGIASPEVRRAVLAGGRATGAPWPATLYELIAARRPDYVVLFPRWFPLLEGEPERFAAVHRIKIDDNVALAGDELVLYSTPWTRHPLLPGAPR